MSKPIGWVLLPRLEIQNLNAVSSPMTWGFPSPTAFTGFVDALQRVLPPAFGATLGGVGIICHRFTPQVSRPPKRWGSTFHLTRNPLNRHGETPAFVEEGRAHADVSLLIEVTALAAPTDALLTSMTACVHAMRIAGGSVIPSHAPRSRPQWFDCFDAPEANADAFASYRSAILPGSALVQREDLLIARLQQLRLEAPGADALDALLDYSRLNSRSTPADPEHPDQPVWQPRTHPGWLVPIPVGYAGLSPLYAPGEVRNARDPDKPFRFVESIYSLGEWLSPTRVTQPDQLMWRPIADPAAGIYRSVNCYADSIPSA